MNRRSTRIAAAAVLGLLAAASGSSAQSLANRVGSAGDRAVQFSYKARPGVCGDGRTYISTAAGNFSATCFGVMQLSGTASGTLNSSVVTWQASGLANGGGITNCAISLSGTATLEGDQIRIPFTGTTCQMPVSGTEILRKQ